MTRSRHDKQNLKSGKYDNRIRFSQQKHQQKHEIHESKTMPPLSKQEEEIALQVGRTIVEAAKGIQNGRTIAENAMKIAVTMAFVIENMPSNNVTAMKP